ncbi:MAG: ROK family protein, partial [Micromonosporaceae bacterium]
VRAAVAAQAARARALGATVVGAGVVAPGVIDVPAGVVRYASNLGWHHVPLRELVLDAVDAPVGVGHDAGTAGIAEGVFGAARGLRHYVHVSIGTGIAASLVVSGHAVTGSVGGAGELGHIPIHPGGEPCPCGQRGCLEAYASGAGLARRYRRLTGRQATARDLVDRQDRDAVARRVWSEGIEALALGLTTCTLLLDPEAVVLGGGLALAGDKLAAPLRASVRSNLTWRQPPAVDLTRLGTDGATIGAALLAMRAAGREGEATRWAVSDGIQGSTGGARHR